MRLPRGGGRKGPEPRKARPCHDVTPWTKFNRVPLCQATLSIGPYLLPKVQFQRSLITLMLELETEPSGVATFGFVEAADLLRGRGQRDPAPRPEPGERGKP